MSVSIGDYLYRQQTSGPDHRGVSWIFVERRAVTAIEDDVAMLSARESDNIPTHSAIEAQIQWYADLPGADQVRIPSIDHSTHSPYSTTLTLPTPAVIDESAVREAWLAYTNHRCVNREIGKPEPLPDDTAQAYQFAVLEWRDGLPSPSDG